MKLKTLLASAVALLCSVGSWAQTWTGNAVAEGQFYLYNVGTGQWLCAANSWGTQASLTPYGGFHVTLVGSGSSFAIKNTELGTNGAPTTGPGYLGSGGYMDSGSENWTFTDLGDNKYRISCASGNLQYSGTGTVVNIGAETGENAQWILVSKQDRLDAMANASKTSPVDATFLIADNSFSRRNLGFTSWTTSKSGGDNKLVQGGDNSNWCFESYHTNNFEVYQMIADAPAGAYGLKAQGFYRQDGTNTSYPYFYLNDKKVTFPVKTGDENSHSAASLAFKAGKYFCNEIKYTYSSGDFKIGAKLEENGQLWSAFDNFVLTYYGNDCSSSIVNAGFDNSTGWTGLGTVSNSEVEYFNAASINLYQDLADLTPGIYAVEVQGFYRNGVEAGTNYDIPNTKRAKNGESLLAYLFATGNSTTFQTALTSIFDEAGNSTSGTSSLFGKIPHSMGEAQTFFTEGLYQNNKVYVEVGADGALRIGVKKDAAEYDDWTLVDNFTLTKVNYASISDAYAAEWATKKAEAGALLSDATYDNILAGDAARSALSNAIAATPSDLEGYYSALTTLRSAVNGFKASKYAYDQYAIIQAAIDAESTTYAHVAGTEKSNFDTNVVASAPASKTAENYYNAVTSQMSYVTAFTDAKYNYDEYYYENETATRLGADVSAISEPTTSADALTAAHAINVINYNYLEERGYEDVSATVLGAWDDDNVGSRSGQHWSGSGEYFEQNVGYGNAEVWTMSRQQTISLSAGSYVLKVAARVASGADAQLSVTVGDGEPIVTYAGHHGDAGLGITTSGEACYVSHDVDDEKVYANSNNGRGFEWRYIPFELDADGEVTLKFYAVNTLGQQHKYVSFCNLGIWCDPAVAAKTDLLTAISNATAARKSANEGSGVFQIPAAAGTTLASAISTAQGVYDDGDAKKEEVIDATSDMNDAITTYLSTTLNAPSSSTRYKLTLADRGALSFDATGAVDEGGYGLPYAAAADYMAQTFFLTQTTGNNYKLSFVDFDGTTRYICTGEKAKEGLGNARIRTTTDVANALEITISATSTANVFNMLNTASGNAKIGSDGGGMYTANNYTSWSIAEASQASVPVTLSSGKYATRIFPFTPSAIDGITYYSCAAVAETDLTLVKEDTPAANTPYILLASKDVDETLEGWGTATKTNYTTGLLTGIYTKQDIAADAHNYVLQTKGDGNQAFCLVTETFTNSQPYRAYLTYEAPAEVKVLNFVFDELPTAINDVETTQNENAVIYNLAGQRLNKAQKGVNIVNGKKVLVK